LAVESKHPDYVTHHCDWEACRDVYEGESAVKRRDDGQRYLPPTVGMRLDWHLAAQNGQDKIGQRNYEAYRARALLSGFLTDAVDQFLGMLWHRPTTFELGMLEQYFGDDRPATSEGETLKQLLRRMHVQAFVTGRMLLMADLPAEELSNPQPYFCLYNAEKVINWDDGARQLARRTLNLVVLDESGNERSADLDWKWTNRYRVLKLGPLATNETQGAYQVAVSEGGTIDEAAFQAPEMRQKPLDQIPAVFVNTKGTTTEVGSPPLLALARRVLALYRMDADFRQYMHVSGQDTLFTKCAEDGEVTSVGAGAHINLKNPKSDARFIGISAAALGEARAALENETTLCAKKAGEMLADNSKQRESGDALAERTGRKGASLIDIAQTCAAGLQQMLRILAKWLGASPAQQEEIKVIPNEKFGTPMFVTDDLMKLIQAYVLGAPITLQSIHEYNVAHGYTTLTWDEMVLAKRSEHEMLSDMMPMPAPKPGDEEPADDAQDDAAE
jgi:hypothetical protein